MQNAGVVDVKLTDKPDVAVATSWIGEPNTGAAATVGKLMVWSVLS